MNEPPVIQKAYDLIKWYVPILNSLPKTHKFGLGQRMIEILYEILENLITARYSRDKVVVLESLNAKVDILRYQTRLLVDFHLMETPRYEYASNLIHEIGSEIGGWLKYHRSKPSHEKSQKPVAQHHQFQQPAPCR